MFFYVFFLPLDAVRVEGGEGWGTVARCRFVSVFFVVLVVLAVVVVEVEVDRGGEGFWGCDSPQAESSSITNSPGEGGLALLGVVCSGSWSVSVGACVSSFCSG